MKRKKEEKKKVGRRRGRFSGMMTEDTKNIPSSRTLGCQERSIWVIWKEHKDECGLGRRAPPASFRIV